MGKDSTPNHRSQLNSASLDGVTLRCDQTAGRRESQRLLTTTVTKNAVTAAGVVPVIKEWTPLPKDAEQQFVEATKMVSMNEQFEQGLLQNSTKE